MVLTINFREDILCSCLQLATIPILCSSLLVAFIPYFVGGCDKAMMDGPSHPGAAYTNPNRKVSVCKIGLREHPENEGYI